METAGTKSFTRRSCSASIRPVFNYTFTMSSIQIQIDRKWESRINSQWFKVVQALRGVAVSFCPLALYWAGGGMPVIAETPIIKWPLILVCCSLIFSVALTYMRIADQVILAVSRSDQSLNPKTRNGLVVSLLLLFLVLAILGSILFASKK